MSDTTELHAMLETVMRESYEVGFWKAIAQVCDTLAPHLKGQQGADIKHALIGLQPDVEQMVAAVNARRAAALSGKPWA